MEQGSFLSHVFDKIKEFFKSSFKNIETTHTLGLDKIYYCSKTSQYIVSLQVVFSGTYIEKSTADVINDENIKNYLAPDHYATIKEVHQNFLLNREKVLVIAVSRDGEFELSNGKTILLEEVEKNSSIINEIASSAIFEIAESKGYERGYKLAAELLEVRKAVKKENNVIKLVK